MDDPVLYSPENPERELEARTLYQKAELIHALDVFSHATVEEAFRLASIASEVRFDAGQVVFHEGEVSDGFYLILEGRVELTASKNKAGQVLGSRDAFGLHSVLAHEPPQATARALEKTLALRFAAEDFFALLSNNMEITASIFGYLVKKLGLDPAR